MSVVCLLPHTFSGTREGGKCWAMAPGLRWKSTSLCPPSPVSRCSILARHVSWSLHPSGTCPHSAHIPGALGSGCWKSPDLFRVLMITLLFTFPTALVAQAEVSSSP